MFFLLFFYGTTFFLRTRSESDVFFLPRGGGGVGPFFGFWLTEGFFSPFFTFILQTRSESDVFFWGGGSRRFLFIIFILFIY